MDEPGQPAPSTVILGDLGDPWVAAMADALSRDALRIDCGGDLPETWPAEIPSGSTLVLQRASLTNTDAERLRRARRAGRFARVILVVGPHARYDHVQRWSTLVEAIIPEATAAEVLARHLGEPGARPRPARRTAICVISTDHELRTSLAESCAQHGYDPSAARDWSQAPRNGIAVWDVPVLETDWPRTLAHEAARRPVVALIGFADRGLVTLARSRGAAACLDLPCDPADLAFTLARIAARAEGTRIEPGHAEPPRPAALARRRSLAERGESP
jgi:hypothetical protein